MKKRSYSSYLCIMLSMLLLAIVAVLMVTVVIRDPEAVPTAQSDLNAVEPAKEASRRNGFYTLLIAGTDTAGTRTDTILLAALDTNTGAVNLLSIPRDTRAYMENGGIHKINAAHNKGIDRMLTEIKNTVGFVPDRYMIIDYEVFSLVIDTLGGVNVDVGMDMDYSDPGQDLEIHLKAGEQKLNGEQALQYMRFRSGYAEGDIGRVKAQQKLLSAVAQKARSLAALKLITKIPAISKMVETNLTAGEMLWLGRQVYSADLTSIQTDLLPGKFLGADYDASRSKTLALINEKYNPYEEPIQSLNIP